MTKALALLLAIACLSLSACSKKAEPAETPPAGPQSSQGKILDAAQKTADRANERSRQVSEDLENASQ